VRTRAEGGGAGFEGLPLAGQARGERPWELRYRLRILHLNCYADPVGGAEVYAVALTRELTRRGHVVGFFGTSATREVDEEHLRVVRRPAYDPRLLWSEPAVSQALASFAARLRPELIHVHNVFSLGLDVMEALGQLGVPTVQTVHDSNRVCPNSWCVHGDGSPCHGGVGAQCFQHDCDRNYPFDAEVALHALLRHRALLELVDVAICPSQALARLIVAHGQRRVVHVPNAIEPIPIPGGVERGTRELLYVGRLTPEKGVETLLEAMTILRRRDPGVTLTLALGGSPPAAELARLHGQPGLTVLTGVPRSDLGRLYARSAVCILPSIWFENAPLVALECMSAGLPLIASRIGALPELVEDGVTGFTFRPRDPTDLAEQVLRFLALGSEERRQLGQRLQERAQRYRLESHVARVEEIYAEVRGVPRKPTIPRTPMDADLRALVARLVHERNAAREPTVTLVPHLGPRLRGRALARMRGIARALHLPKFLPR